MPLALGWGEGLFVMWPSSREVDRTMIRNLACWGRAGAKEAIISTGWVWPRHRKRLAGPTPPTIPPPEPS